VPKICTRLREAVSAYRDINIAPGITISNFSIVEGALPTANLVLRADNTGVRDRYGDFRLTEQVKTFPGRRPRRAVTTEIASAFLSNIKVRPRSPRTLRRPIRPRAIAAPY
jgi:hypothetical protein